MRAIFRHRKAIGLAATFAFVLAGCSTIKIDATDLSAVSIENDRLTIEKSLGKSREVFETSNLTVAAYRINRGHIGTYSGLGDIGAGGGGGSGGELLLLPLFLAIVGTAYAIDYSNERAEARERQEGILAAVFDADDKLTFAAEVPTPSSDLRHELSRLAELYSKAQVGDPNALHEAGSLAFFAEQKSAYLEAAVNKGNGEAAYDLGTAYQQGLSYELNEKTAFKWWQTAAQLGHTPAYLRMAEAYRFGIGVSRNTADAEIWLNKAADAGSTEAQQILSDIYKADAVGATAQFSSLLTRAEEGQKLFQVKVAREYRYGTLTPKDANKAIHWYVRAAAAGDDFAPYALGTMYEKGEAGSPRLILAYAWYGIADRVSPDLGPSIRIRRDRLRTRFTQTQAAMADRLVGQWSDGLAANSQNGDPLARIVAER